jgi:hypothetical protein
MAEQVIRVCDVCGAPAMETVTLKVGGKTYQKDLCAEHLESLTQGEDDDRRPEASRQTAEGWGG